MIRFILADRLGFSWNDIKNLPAHYIKQYLADIEKSKNHFKGINRGDAKKYALAAQSAGIPVK